MTVILDHLLAVIISAFLIATIFAIQLRERQEVTAETLGHAAQREASSLMVPVADDLQNAWAPAQAGGGVMRLDTFTTGQGSAQGLTRRVLFPAKVRTSVTDSSARALAQVTYDLAETPDTVDVMGTPLVLFRLVRRVDFDPFSAATGLSGVQVDTLASSLVGFDVGYVRGVSMPSTSDRVGTPATGVHSFRVAGVAARPGPAQLGAQLAYLASSHTAPFSGTFRPPNL